MLSFIDGWESYALSRGSSLERGKKTGYFCAQHLGNTRVRCAVSVRQVGPCAYNAAAALPGGDETVVLQHTDGLSDGVAAGTVLFHQLCFCGKKGTTLVQI